MTRTDFAAGSSYYQYDADSKRVSQRTADGFRQFVYRGPDMLKLQLERDESEETVAHYTMGAGLEAMRREASSFYHYNHLGTTLALTGADEAVSDTYRLDAWGVLLASTGSTINPYTYVGQQRYYRMPRAAMYHLGLRDYLACIGRFLRPDRVGGEAYLYSGAQPSVKVDPYGLDEKTGWWERIKDALERGITGNCYVDCLHWIGASMFPLPGTGTAYWACVKLCTDGYSPHLWPFQLMCKGLDAARSKVGRDCWDCACGASQISDVFAPSETILVPGPVGWIIGGIGIGSELFDCGCNVLSLCDQGVTNLPISTIATIWDCIAPVTGGEPIVDTVTAILQNLEQGGDVLKQQVDACCRCL